MAFGDNQHSTRSEASSTANPQMMPHDLDAEQATLGAMLIDGAATERMAEVLDSDDFYRPANRTLFESMISLATRNEAVDLVTTTNELKRQGKLDDVGGAPFLAMLMEAVPNAANVEYYANIVQAMGRRRRLMRAGLDIVRLASGTDEDPRTMTELIDDAESRIYQVARSRDVSGLMHIQPMLGAAFDQIETLFHEKKHVTGVPTGYQYLDEMTAGWQRGDLVIVAARPSMGKTSLAMNMAEYCSIHHGSTVAVFSLEMGKEQLVQRMICSQAEVNGNLLRQGRVPEEAWDRIQTAVSRLWEAKIFIDDTPSASALEIRSKCRRLKSEHGLDLVVIDYLQLMRGHRKNENRNQEISDIAHALKALAREVQAPVIALSQLSRSVESRDDKRPMLSDLRDSGTIEQAADVVAFIYRDTYYKQKALKNGDEGEFEQVRPIPGAVEKAEIIVAKQRNGPTGSVKVGFKADYARFVPLDFTSEE